MILFSNQIDYHAGIFQNKPGLPYLVMLHGFMGSGRVFEYLVDPLKMFCNPVTIDLAGHGRSNGSADPERYKTQPQISDLLSLLNRLQLSPLVLYGYSMGGRLALQFALKHPDLVDSLILESSTAGIPDEKKRSLRKKTDEQRAKHIRNNFPEFLDQWMQNPIFTESGTSHSDSNNKYRKVMEQQNPGYLAASLQGFGTGSMEPVWHRLKTFHKPALLIAGEKDEKFVTLNRSMNEKFPRSNFIMVERASHRVHVDRPAELVHHIETFIKNNLQAE